MHLKIGSSGDAAGDVSPSFLSSGQDQPDL
jgi:hypothetical protein